MKKIIYITIVLLYSSIGYSQVGIGTTNPQEDLHISGTNSSIRIESLNSTNNVFNDGIKLAPAYVDGNGDVTIGNGTGGVGESPFNFLIEVPNFVPDAPYAHGINTGTAVLNDDLGQTQVQDTISTVTFTAPQDAIIEVKYGITIFITASDITVSPAFPNPPWYYVAYDQAVALKTYFKVDLNNDGLIGDELTKEYGQKAQYYATYNQGSAGYPYMNGQAYLTVPAGTHTLYFYGRVNDDAAYYTGVGFGGAQDYLKIRVYN